MSHSQMQRYIISPYSPHISQKICFENNKNTQSLVNSAYCYSVVNPILHLYLYIITADALPAKNSRSVTERNPPATCPRSFILLYQLINRLVKCFRRLDDIVVLPEIGITKIIHPVEEGIT